MQISDLLQKLDRGDCPSPARIALDLLELLDSPEAGISDAAAIVGRDPVLTAKTINIANSPLYRGLRPSVAIEDAIMRTGLQTLAQLALSLSLVSHRPKCGVGLDLMHYWSAALTRGTAMQAMARHLSGWSAAELFTLGLLADIGRLILACTAPDEYAQLARTTPDQRELFARERKHFGFDHRQLSTALLQHWSLPEFMALAVDPNSSAPLNGDTVRFTRLRAMLELASIIGERIEGLREELVPTQLAQRAAQLDISAQALNEILLEAVSQWRSLAALFDIEPPKGVMDRLDQLHNAASGAGPPRNKPMPSVLVVDDDANSRILLRRFLEPSGYEVVEADNAEHAIDTMQQSLARILIVDWLMPGLNGPDICRSLRQQFGGRLYLLILSAFIDNTRAIEAIEAGANDFLEKPVSRKLLLAKLQVAQRTVELTQTLEDEKRRSEHAQRELMRLNDILRQAATHDALTGLFNRRAFDAYLQNAWETARRHDMPLSCIMFDIDFFKRINDQHGHDAGDRAIRALAELLRSNSRAGDRAARYGGEEFTMLCINSGAQSTQQLGERLREMTEQLRGDYPAFTISAGVAEMSPDMHEPAELMRAADRCLLEAKRGGRNRVISCETN